MKCESARVRECGVALPFSPLRILVPRPVRVYSKEPKTIGDYLRRQRLALGLSQVAAADRLGVMRDCVSLWERGKFEPRGKRLNAVIAFLGFDPSFAKAA